MSEKNKINVFSEIGKLKKVLIHRPGEEVENLTPELLPRLLFDDILYLKRARKEHDIFAAILKDKGIEVVYIENLVAEAISTSSDIKSQFIFQFLYEAGIREEEIKDAISKYFLDLPTKEMVDKMIAGVLKEELSQYKFTSLYALVNDSYPFFCDPLPNVLFTRDPFASIGNGVSIHKMRRTTRRRETIFAEYVFKYHPEYKNANIPLWYNRNEDSHIEGGDILVLNKEILAIGISERTESRSLEKIAKKLFEENTSFKTILGFQIPPMRSYMHLDTVLTQIDHNIFTIHSCNNALFTLYELTKDSKLKNGIKIKKENATVDELLGYHLGTKIKLIECADGHPIYSSREQWNDGANTLAIAPGEIIVYNRNHVTNKILRNHGIKVNEMPSSELSKGRGGPRCMSMPLIREDI